MKYGFIKQHSGEFSIRAMCRYFSVSSSGYYDWLGAKPSTRLVKQQQRNEHVKVLFEKYKSRYGAPRIHRELQTQFSHRCNVKTVANALRNLGLCAKAARKFKATTNSKHSLPVAPNLLEQCFKTHEPNRVWVGDITYLNTDEGWLYLAIVLDLFSRKVVGWSMNATMTKQLVSDALRAALATRHNRHDELIFHSDRGAQYCSKQFSALLNSNGIRASMSGKGNCYDNACAESFFHSMKVEAIHGMRFATREQMKQTVFEYIEVDYNRQRLHSSLGYLSPCEFESQYHHKIAS